MWNESPHCMHCKWLTQRSYARARYLLGDAFRDSDLAFCMQTRGHLIDVPYEDIISGNKMGSPEWCPIAPGAKK